VDDLLGVGAIIASRRVTGSNERRTNQQLEHDRDVNESG
jgi:hypothetical protein